MHVSIALNCKDEASFSDIVILYSQRNIRIWFGLHFGDIAQKPLTESAVGHRG